MRNLAYALGACIQAVALGYAADGRDRFSTELVEVDIGAGYLTERRRARDGDRASRGAIEVGLQGGGVSKNELSVSAESFRFEDYQNFASGQAETFIEEARAASAAALQDLYKVFPVGSPVARLVNFIENSEEESGNYCRKRPDSEDRIFCQYAHLWAQDPEGILVLMWWLNIQYDPDTGQILDIRLRVGTA